jgi:hypothetical protein
MTQQGDYSVGTRGNREPNKGTTGFCVRGTKRGETYRTVPCSIASGDQTAESLVRA